MSVEVLKRVRREQDDWKGLIGKLGMQLASSTFIEKLPHCKPMVSYSLTLLLCLLEF